MSAPEIKGLTLYIVEDDSRTRQELERILTRHTDLNLRCFAAPAEALEAIEDDAPDLALIDIRLPQMDGLSLLERMAERVPDLMAIIMTGYGEAETPRKAREKGAVDFVQKPLDLPYLLVVLRQLARECALRRNLKDSASLFSRLIEMMPDGILMSDGTGEILFTNNLGRRLYDSGALEPGSQNRLDGRTYVLEKSVSGERLLWHWSDLTQALERERFSAFRQMARFLAHEIRNPLTPMRLWLQELEGTPPTDPKYSEMARQAVAVLLGQVDRLMELVQRFKTLGEALPLALAPVTVLPVIGEVASALAPLAARKGVLLAMPKEGDWVAKADEASLYQLLFNLVRNALESEIPAGGRVSLYVDKSGSDIEIAVSDEGGGLPAEVAAAPFTPYLTTKEGGSGLGLLICQELASRMGGRLELENREGKGVTTRVFLSKEPSRS
jgi:signal transduction histidine kinase